MAAIITLSRAQVQQLADFCAERNRTQYFIAKDQGAYLGASVGAQPDQQCLFYFPGCDPRTDEDWWDACSDKFGGDDFGERMKATDLTTALAEPRMTACRWSVGTRRITMTLIFGKQVNVPVKAVENNVVQTTNDEVKSNHGQAIKQDSQPQPAEEPIMNAFTQAREYRNRQSATAVLKKLGVAQADYNTFITMDDGRGIVLLAYDAAAAAVALAKAPKGRKVHGSASVEGPDIDETTQLDAARPKRNPKVDKAVKTAAVRTVTSVALAMIRSGASNTTVWAALQAEFKLDDAKRTYPAWYRRHLRVKFNEVYANTTDAGPAAESTRAAAEAIKKAKAVKPVKTIKASAKGAISAAAADPFRRLG